MASPLVLKAGAMLYGVGLLIETFADGQKYFFKQAHPGQFTNVGLWSISQHPNFFGNLVLWAGIFVMNAPAMIDPLPKNVSLWKRIWACRRLVVSLLGPWFMWTLFSGQAKGTLSKTMELASSKYGNDPAYSRFVNARGKSHKLQVGELETQFRTTQDSNDARFSSRVFDEIDGRIGNDTKQS
jgi:hypothetical protein